MPEPRKREHVEPSWKCNCADCERRRWLAYDQAQMESEPIDDGPEDEC